MTTKINCGDLDRKIEMPVELPKMKHDVFERLKRRSDELQSLFRVFAREMGIKEILFPYFSENNECEIGFDPVDIDKVDVWVVDHGVRIGDSFLGVVFTVVLHALHNRIYYFDFPFARDERWEVAKYVDTMGSLLLTNAFIAKNPQAIEALKKAMETIYRNAYTTYDTAVKFYNALMLVGGAVDE